MARWQSFAFCLVLIIDLTPALSASSDSKSDMRSIYLQSSEFRQAVSSRLEREGVPFVKEGDVILRYHREDGDRIREIIADVADDFLPIGRSVSYAPNLQRVFKQKLQEAGISYREERHDDHLWIVWSEEDDPRVTEIQIWLKKHLLQNPQLLNPSQ